MQCNKQLLNPFLDDELEEPERKNLQTHLKDCHDCKEKLNNLTELRKVLLSEKENIFENIIASTLPIDSTTKKPSAHTQPSCLSDNDIEKYIKQKVSNKQTQNAIEHISECLECFGRLKIMNAVCAVFEQKQDISQSDSFSPALKKQLISISTNIFPQKISRPKGSILKKVSQTIRDTLFAPKLPELSIGTLYSVDKKEQPHKWKIEIYKGREKIQEYEIKNFPVRIGRTKDNDIIFSDNYVSRHHAEIKLENDKLVLYDLKSKNGIFINNLKIKKAELADGDVVQIGRNSFVVRQR